MTLGAATLRTLYVVEKKTTREIADIVGINHRSVTRLMRRYEVPARPRGERRSTLEQRFDAKYRIVESGCWEWTAALNPGGYGQFAWPNPTQTAHLYSYRRFKGLSPDGHEVDHLCRNRRCVNPDHLEAVPKRENVLRGNGPTALNARAVTCTRGHPITGRTTTQRLCRICRRASGRAYYHRERRARASA